MVKNIVEVSESFKSEVKKAIAAIVLFVIVYMLIVIFALGLTAFSVYAGISIIVAAPSFITLALGLGIASLGVLVLLFIIKFVFKTHKTDRAHLMEITQDDEPEIFRLINEIVNEVGTQFPKKVYLSPDVNASVFYDSSFWSMFLPIKKNLQIGLGLVNSITDEEFKAILAHEFGHFSQQSMKVGSYVYNVNQIIFNMLFDNQSFDMIAQRWASLGWFSAIFVIGAIKIINAIQWILGKLYELVNKSYMALSREMEFHADEIAANITGYEPLKSSLLRMQLTDFSYNTVLNYYEKRFDKAIKSPNIYKEHQYVFDFFAKDSELESKYGLPQVTLDQVNKFNKSKLVIKDQWSSHPSTEERILALEKLKIELAPKNEKLANNIFTNLEEVQKQMTEKLFSFVKYKETPKSNSLLNFKENFEKEHKDYSFNKIYNGYYDNKNPVEFDLDCSNSDCERSTIEHLFSTANLENVYTEIAFENDIAILKGIERKEINIRTFDYDGVKYNAKDVRTVIRKIVAEQDKVKELIKENDITIYLFFIHLAKEQRKEKELQEKYEIFFLAKNEIEEKLNVYNKLMEATQFISQITPFDVIEQNFYEIKKLEVDLKKELNWLLNDKLSQDIMEDKTKEIFTKYLSKDLVYFKEENYFDNALDTLFSCLNSYQEIISQRFFSLKKQLLSFQVGLLTEVL